MTMARSQTLPKKDKSPRKSSRMSLVKNSDKKKRSKINDLDFKYYLHKVLKQVHKDDITISRRAIVIMNDFMVDILQRIGGQASTLARIDQKHRAGERLTGKAIVKIDSRHIQTSVRFMLPGELGKHAVSEGTKAVQNYYKNSNKN